MKLGSNANNVNVSSNVNSINTAFKNSIKTIISNAMIFPKISEKISSMEMIKNKPILSLRPFTQVVYNDDVKHEIFSLMKEKELKEFFEGVIKGNKTFEADYISKPFTFYNHNDFFKLILLSNFYKIFLNTIISMNNSISCVDFYQILILICPDFPKNIVKRINILYFHLKIREKNPEKQAQYEEMDNEISVMEFFVYFSIYVFSNDYFKEFEKLFGFNFDSNAYGLSQGQGGNPANTGIPNITTAMPASILNLSSNFQVSCEVLGKVSVQKIKDKLFNIDIQNTTISKPNIEIGLEALITCETSMHNEYNSNTINLIDDVLEIIAKSEKEITFIDFFSKFIKNYNMLKAFFDVDEFLVKMENVIGTLDKLD